MQSRRSFRRMMLVTALLYLFFAGAAHAAVELTWLVTGDANRQRIYEDVVAQFERENPGVKINILLTSVGEARQKLLNMILGGVAPDLMHIRAAGAYEIYQMGAAAQLDAYIERDGFDTSNLAPAYGSMLYDGKWYGMPFDGGGFLVDSLFVNRDIFLAAGLAVPEYDPDRPESVWTWEEFRDDLRKVTIDRNGDGTPEQFGFDQGPGIYDIAAWSNGGDILSEDRTRALIDQPEFYEAFQWWADLRNIDHVLPWQGEVSGTPWLDGRLGVARGAMMVAASWAQAGLPFDWSAMAWPRGKAGSIARREMNPIAISATSPHKDVAWEFIKFWLSDPVQERVVIAERAVPPQTFSVASQRDFWYSPQPPYDYRPFIFPEAKELPYVPQWSDIHNAIIQAMQPAWLGNTSAQAAAQEAARLVNAILGSDGH